MRGFIRFLLLALGLQAASVAHAEPVIRGVFVGIDHYLYSRQADRNGSFSDLNGAVADTRVMKSALETAYHLRLDEPVEGRCASRNAISITLTDHCASRDAIYDALADQIEASSPGDTIIFFFAGHGSRIVDDQVFDQASGYNDTLLAADARQPGASESKEILDRDLRKVIDTANARGVNVVTIFDSCNSGTATRRMRVAAEGRSRGVRAISGGAHVVSPRFRLDPIGRGGGYRVHFGAAADHEQAREIRQGDSVNGVFTIALARELVAMPGATFGDLAAAVRLKVEQAGYKSQHPQAEGALQASLIGGNGHAALYQARPGAGMVTLQAGRLLGLTKGSKFELFRSQRDALAETRRPIATGSIVALDDGQSMLALDPTPSVSLPAELVARETEHFYAGEKLAIFTRTCDLDRDDQLIANALQGLDFVETVASTSKASFSLVRLNCHEEDDVHLVTKDATGVSTLGMASDPAFAARLRAALLPIYNARRFASLPMVDSGEAGIELCITHQTGHAVGQCPEAESGRQKLEADKEALLTVTNTDAAARQIYVLVMDDRYAITQMIPAHGGRDPPMASGATQKSDLFSFDSGGTYRFFVIASDAPINTSVLEQPGVRWNYTKPCDPDREDIALCGPSGLGNARGEATSSLGKWSIMVRDVKVEYPREPSGQLIGADTFDPARAAGPQQADDPAPLPGPDTAGPEDEDQDPAATPDPPTTEPTLPEAEEGDEGDSRIVGGTEALTGTAKWQAEIYTTYNYSDQDTKDDLKKPLSERYFLAQKDKWEKIHRCGAVYIGDLFVLTAAHCVHGIGNFGKTRRVRLATQDLRFPGYVFEITGWEVHRGFRNAEPYPNDIALLRIKADNLAAARLDLKQFEIRILGSSDGDLPVSGRDSLRVTGWGRTKARAEGQSEIARDGTRNRMSPVLLQINQRESNAECAGRDGYRDILPEKTICAVSDVAGQDSCNGDSGGPMTVARGNERLLVGLVSWGRGCALPGMPAVYTDVTRTGYLPWIETAKRTLLDREAAAARRAVRQ